MSSGIIVSVKTRPYLKDWIVEKYGAGEEPVKASSSNKLFPLLAQYLSHKPNDWKPPKQTDDSVLFELPYNEVFEVRNMSFIHEKNFPEISSFFYGMFHTSFVRYMNEKCFSENRKRWRFKYAIYRFMDENNISIDKINYDSLKRIYLRYRKQFSDYDEKIFDERPKKIKKISPNSHAENEHKLHLIGT